MVNDNVDISLAMIRTILDDISTVHITTTFRFATLPHWQCDQIWRNFAILAKLKKVFSKSLSVALVFGKNNYHTLASFNAIGHFFHFAK